MQMGQAVRRSTEGILCRHVDQEIRGHFLNRPIYARGSWIKNPTVTYSVNDVKGGNTTVGTINSEDSYSAPPPFHAYGT
jgi:hypothetical protein